MVLATSDTGPAEFSVPAGWSTAFFFFFFFWNEKVKSVQGAEEAQRVFSASVLLQPSSLPLEAGQEGSASTQVKNQGSE